MAALRENRPDIIVLTGDLIDSRRTDINSALRFVSQIRHIAPVYFVSGNHEAAAGGYERLLAGLREYGVTLLDNSAALLERGGAAIALLGVADPMMAHDYMTEDAAVTATLLDRLTYDRTLYSILLSHRPELFEVYREKGIDLALTGHAHGGQIVLPFLGGLVAPNQGLFPKYWGGLYQAGGTAMVVSRGIGNSILPFRINNRPELVIVTLHSRPA